MKHIYLPAGWDPAKPLVMHAMAHSMEGGTLFYDEADEAAFERAPGIAATDSEVEVLSYCPNGNHYHLLLFGNRAQVGRFMHRLQTCLSRRCRERYGGRGHVVNAGVMGPPVAVVPDPGDENVGYSPPRIWLTFSAEGLRDRRSRR
jgi:hypothetical protein